MNASDTKITFDLGKLDKLRRQLGNDYQARVGVLGAKASRSHQEPGQYITNAELGVIHEFGSETNNIPPRSFLRMPIETKYQVIVKFLGSDIVKEKISKGDILGVFKLIGIKGEQIVQEAFETRGFGKWAPNTEQTIDRKGSSAPLINFGELRRSISSDVVKNAT